MPIRGTITLNGDKSISHRALMIGSITNGKSIIKNLSTGLDVQSTIKCVEACGSLIKKDKTNINIYGSSLKNPKSPLNCGNSGTTARLMAGLLCGQGISAKFFGDKSLSSRPMDRIIIPLQKMGAKIHSEHNTLPFLNISESLSGINYKIPVASAQVKSCLMLAALGANTTSQISESIKTRDHTEKMLKKLGANISIVKNQIYVEPLKNKLESFEYFVPGDPSSAAFFAAAAAMIPNSELMIKNISANPTRIGFFNILKKMGGGVEWDNIRQISGELVGDVHIYFQPLNGISIDKTEIPSLIDELPIISILATIGDSPTVIQGAEELRFKETDRIHAICCNLKRMGVDVIEKKDGLIINAPSILHSTSISTFNDHRIAMAFTIAGLSSGQYNKIDNEECINISFPEFFTVLRMINR